MPKWLLIITIAFNANAVFADEPSANYYGQPTRLLPANFQAEQQPRLIAAKPQVIAAASTFDKTQVQEQIRDMSDTLKRIHHASGELHSEVNRRQMISTGPDYMDQMIMDPWMSAYPGLNPTGMAAGFQNMKPGPLLPPRKRYVDVSMTQLQQLITLLDTDVSNILAATQQGNANSDAIKAQMLIVSDAKNRIDSANQKLIALTKGAPYDNKAISTATEDIRDDVASINELRHRISKMLDRD